MPTKDNNFPTNGWTNYQKLVLNELQRHEDKLDAFQKEMVKLEISNSRLELEIKNVNDNIKKFIEEFDTSERALSGKIEALTKEKETLTSELNQLKWKIGLFASGLSATATIIIQAIIKFWMH